jgi:hypothetical protein
MRHGLAYKKKNQSDYLNQIMPRDYNIGWGYTNALNTILVCFTLSAGIPLFYVICSFTMFGLFLVEKYKLFEHSKKPPRMSKNLIRISVYCLYIALVMHLVFTISMQGNTKIFKKTRDEIQEDDQQIYDSFDTPRVKCF